MKDQQVLSRLPLFSKQLPRKERKKVENAIADTINKMKDNGKWLSLKKYEKDLDNFVSENKKVLVTIDTSDYTFAAESNTDISPKRIQEWMNEKTKFHTWEEIKAKIWEWKVKKFDSNKSGSNLNSCFRMIRIFSTPKGFIWCNQYDISYPESVLDQLIHF